MIYTPYQCFSNLSIYTYKGKNVKSERKQIFVLTHIYGILKSDIDETICREGMEMQIQRTRGDGESGLNVESSIDIYTLLLLLLLLL